MADISKININSTNYNIVDSNASRSNHTHNYAGSSSAGGVATNSYALQSNGTLDTQEKIDNFLEANKLKYALFKTTEQNNVGMASNDGMLISLPWSSTTYGAQIALDDSSAGTLKFRGKSTNWGSWRTVIHDGNYTSYCTPANIGAAIASHTHSNYLTAHQSLASCAKLQTWNNLVHSSNEVTIVPGSYSGTLWFNYRTASGSTDGNISEYEMGNGKAGYAAVKASKFVTTSGIELY